MLILVTSVFIIRCSQQDSSVVKSNILASKHARPLRDIRFTSSPERIERGSYLANGVLRCFTCHSPVDSTQPGYPPIKGKEGSGGLMFKTDSFHLYAPNITPDVATGAGSWTDDMFARAIREGVGHDGRALQFAMPFETFSNLSDEDLAAVVVYLKSIPAIENKLPRRHVRDATEQRLQNAERPKLEVVSSPDLSTLENKGRYLVAIGECEGCHTGWYKRNPGVFGGGNFINTSLTDSVCSPNITPDDTGIGPWDDATFIRIIRTGKGGSLHWIMPWKAFANLNDDDLKAILAALKTLAPVQHRVINGMPPTYCEVCGEQHGYGVQNKIVPLKPYTATTGSYTSYAGTYVSNKYGDTTVVAFKNKKLWIDDRGTERELIPVSATKFQADGFMAPVGFEKDGGGKVNRMLLYDIITDTSSRVK